MEFEWDHDKATANARKHGVAFAEVMTIETSDCPG